MEHNEVIVIDHAVGVLVYEEIGNRIAVVVIYLLVDEICEGRLTYEMPLEMTANTYRHVTCGDGIGFGISGKCGDLVAVPADINACAPSEILGLNGTAADRGFDTVVAESTDICVHVVRRVHAESRGPCEKVLGVTQIPVEYKSKTVVEEAEVNAGIPGGGSLPFDLGVVSLGIKGLDPLAVPYILEAVLVRILIDRQVREEAVAYILLACLAPSEAELELVKISVVAETEAVVDLPAESHRGE